MLTASANNFVGTEKGDVFNAYEEFTPAGKFNTLTGVDSLDGGAGKDVLNVKSDNIIEAITATISNIETINLESGAKDTAGGIASIKFDTTTFTGVETLNVTKADSLDLTAAATTDVNVSGATGAIITTGGKNVDIQATGNSVTSKEAAGTVTVTDAGKATVATTIVVENGTDVTVNATTNTTSGTITVGDTAAPHDAAKAATADVEVNSTFTTVAKTDAIANKISVDGGKTITVNQMVTSSDTVLANTTGQTITQGAVAITGQDTTTTVTVKQEKSTAENAAVVAVAEKLSTSTVTFKGMASGDSVTVNGLTFIASKALTAAEVAAAFANLEIGDTQVNSGPTANGIFTGVNGTAGTAIWTSGTVTNVDATTSTVTYSANVAGAATALVVANSGTAVLPVASAPTVGVLAVDAEAGVTGIVNGAVTITDGGIDSIKTISVDGYADSTITADVLETLTLANSGGATAGATNATMTVTTASTGSLTLNLDNVNGNVNLDGGGATLTGLNITTTGKKSDFALTAAAVKNATIDAGAELVINAIGTGNVLETVTVKGTAAVTLGTVAASSNLKSFDASANTGGVTATVNANATTMAALNADGYVFSAGNDVVTLADKTVSKKITLGAGDDIVTLASTTTALAAMIDGGAGTDTLHMDSADAKTASAGTTFEANISNFEKLSLGFSSATETVDLDNMDDISYVISANSGTTATGASVTWAGAIAGINQNDTININYNGTGAGDVTVGIVAGAAGTAEKLAAINAALDLKYGAGKLVATATNGGADLTITAAGNIATDTLVGVAYTDVDGEAAVASTTATSNDAVGANPDIITYTDAGNVVNSLTEGDTIEFSYTAGGTTTALTATIGATTGATATANEVQLAINIALLTAGLATGVATASFNANDLLITAGGNVVDGIELVVGDYTDVDGADAVKTVADGTETAAGSSAIALTLDNMANNGTLELTAAGAGVIVKMKDASGKTDTFNIVTGDEAGDVGTVVVNSVETINVTTTDIFTDDGLIAGIADDGKDDSNSSSTLAVSADAAKTVNVSGAGDLVLDMAGNTAVTLIDGSKMTGNLTVTAYNSDMTVKGGAGDDTLSVYGTGTISVSGVVLTGGNGTDTFDVSAFNSLGNAGSAVTITDLTAGETIVFKGSTGAEKFVSSKVTLIAESTFAQYVSKAAEIANTASSGTEANIAWFQFNNNTFVVQDVDSLGAFNNGDIIVKINGLVDLSTASYNATSNTLEIA